MFFLNGINFAPRRIHAFINIMNHSRKTSMQLSLSDQWKTSPTFRDLLSATRAGGIAKEMRIEEFLQWYVNYGDRSGHAIYLTDMLWCIEKRSIDHEFLMMRFIEYDKRTTWIRIERDTYSWGTSVSLPIPAHSVGWNRKDLIMIAADGNSLIKQDEDQYCHAQLIFHNLQLTIHNIACLLHSCGARAKNYNLFTHNCYWFARTIWWDLTKYTGGYGLEFGEPGRGRLIEDVLKKVEARGNEARTINPPGDMDKAIKFTRHRRLQHISKSVGAMLVAVIIGSGLVGGLVASLLDLRAFSKHFDGVDVGRYDVHKNFEKRKGKV